MLLPTFAARTQRSPAPLRSELRPQSFGRFRHGLLGGVSAACSRSERVAITQQKRAARATLFVFDWLSSIGQKLYLTVSSIRRLPTEYSGAPVVRMLVLVEPGAALPKVSFTSLLLRSALNFGRGWFRKLNAANLRLQALSFRNLEVFVKRKIAVKVGWSLDVGPG